MRSRQPKVGGSLFAKASDKHSPGFFLFRTKLFVTRATRGTSKVTKTVSSGKLFITDNTYAE